MFQRLKTLVRGFLSLFISGLEKANPRALIEAEKENLRQQISRFNDNLANHAGFVERLMRLDVGPSLDPTEVDVLAYIAAVLARFREPAIAHQLSQIAWDGSQKLRFRLLETCRDALEAGRPVERLAVGGMVTLFAKPRP